MSTRKRGLNKDDIARAFAGPAGQDHPVILSPQGLAALLGLSVKTVYDWIAREVRSRFARRLADI